MNFQIKKAAVLGAGVMGAGIAAHIVGAGIPVLLLDICSKELTDKEKNKGLSLDHLTVRNRFAQAGKDRVSNPKNRSIYDKSMRDMIQVGNFEDDFHLLKDCDWVIEVIVENLDIKKQLMKKIHIHCTSSTIISSNTSGISINQIAEDMPMEFKQRFLGTHFFNPPRYMKLFEIIPNKNTLPELVTFMKSFAENRLGKGVVTAKDTPGFIGNRIGTFAMVNVMQLMDTFGFDIAKTDQLTGTILSRPKSATFRTIDLAGIDIFSHVAQYLSNTAKNQDEKKLFITPDFVKQLIENGCLGDKAKKGFYKKTKTEKGKQILMWDTHKKDYVELTEQKIAVISNAKRESNPLKTIIYGDSPESKFCWNIIKNVLLYSAKKIPEITEDYKEIDKAMMWGFNWEKGPFAIWDTIGFKTSVSKMKEDGEVIPAWIEERIKNNQLAFYDDPFNDSPYIRLVSPAHEVIQSNKDAELRHIGDGILCLNFKTKGNTITEEVMGMMFHAVEETESNYKGLVIGNQSKNFSPGANLALIAQLAENKDWLTIDKMIHHLQQANLCLKYCSKPVIAAPYGMTLGGGAEITLHAHKVTAHAETYMGLVEMGVGLVPAGGGAKELLFRSMEDLGNVSNAEKVSHLKKAWENIATAKVSSSGHDAISNGYIRKNDYIVMNKDQLIDMAKKEALYLFGGGFRPLQKKSLSVLGTSGRASLEYYIDFMLNGGFVSPHDALIAKKIANILTGGDVPAGVTVSEQQILELEKEAFISLCGEEKTKQRIAHMLKKGKPLRN